MASRRDDRIRNLPGQGSQTRKESQEQRTVAGDLTTAFGPPASGNDPVWMVKTSQRLFEEHPAVAETVPLLRSRLAGFAERAGLGTERVESLRLALSEAVTNVVRHAYPERPGGQVMVTAAVAGGELWILVADDGCGHQTPSRDPGLGLGLAIIAHECDRLVVTERAAGGTELRMRFLL